MSAGVEGWLSLPDLPPGLDAHLRPRHAHRIDAGEHHRRAVPCRQALCDGGREPEARQMGAHRGAAAHRQDAGHPRPGRHRPGRGAHRRRARHARDRHAARGRPMAERRARSCPPRAPTRCWRNPTSCCCCCRRRPRPTTSSMPSGWRKMKPGAWLLNFGRGHIIKDDDLIAAVEGARRSPAPCSTSSARSRCPRSIRSGRPRASSCCRISAARIPQRDRFVARLFVDNLGRFLDGAPLKEVVDRSAGY